MTDRDPLDPPCKCLKKGSVKYGDQSLFLSDINSVEVSCEQGETQL